MLAELLDRLCELADEARGVTFHALAAHPRTTFVRSGSTLEEKEIPPPDRAHTLRGYADVIRAAHDSEIAPRPELYFDAAALVLILDRADRRARVTMPLVESERFKLLRDLRKVRDLSQRDAVRLLRYDLHGSGVDTVLAELRTLDFKRTSDGAGSVQHGRESLGRAVEAAVQRVERIPESFSVRVPVWNNAGLRAIEAQVAVGLFLKPGDEAQPIALGVLADEIDRNLCLAHAELRAMLEKDLPNVPIFNGAP